MSDESSPRADDRSGTGVNEIYLKGAPGEVFSVIVCMWGEAEQCAYLLRSC